MKVKVKEIFKDKYTNEIYKLNDEIEVTEQRFKEIKDYVEKVNKNNNEASK